MHGMGLSLVTGRQCFLRFYSFTILFGAFILLISALGCHLLNDSWGQGVREVFTAATAAVATAVIAEKLVDD